MKGPDEERLLAFLEGELAAEERERLLAEVEGSPELAARLRAAAAGLADVHALAEAERQPRAGREAVEDDAPDQDLWRGPGRSRARERAGGTAGSAPDNGHGHGVPWRWAATAVAASAILAASTTFALTSGTTPAPPDASPLLAVRQQMEAAITAGRPASPDPSFVLVLQGWWPDAASIDGAEVQRRSREYWAWTTRLAQEGRLVAAGDLRIEAGARVGPEGSGPVVAPSASASPDFLIGMFAVRARSYDEALEIARNCPHLRYGGSVAVRQVGGGFVTVPGMGDWTD